MMFKGFSVLFIIDDMASNSSIVKKRTPLSTLAISGRHTKRSLLVLTQKYNVREQAKWVCGVGETCRKVYSSILL